MNRIVVGALAMLMLVTGAFPFWQGKAANSSTLPNAPAATATTTAQGARLFAASATPAFANAREATPRTREDKRFGRADKDKDGKITTAELLAPRQKAFAKLDLDRNGGLSFNEWAAKTLTKFEGADDDNSGTLTAAEYAQTAPKPKARNRCAC